MPYSCTIQKLFDVLAVVSPYKINDLRAQYRNVEYGLLSVGLKIHGLATTPGFDQFFEALGERNGMLPINLYKQKTACFCLVLPPVGSAKSAITLVRCIERYTGCAIFGNPLMQLQVCSPGRLDARRAALLAIAFYLGSDTLRQYTESQFTTTVSCDDRYNRGTRIVLYDAPEHGEFDRAFAWWKKHEVLPMLPFDTQRTDLLIGTGSQIDIENINFAATLLAHHQHRKHKGRWCDLGNSFEKDLSHILHTHMLTGILEVPWVHSGGVMDLAGDQNFLGALQELTAYAFDEAEQISRHNRSHIRPLEDAPRSSILDEVRTIFKEYRAAIVTQTGVPKGGYA